MKEPRAALRYAKALIDLAIERKSLDTVYKDILLAKEVCHTSKEFTVFLKSPIVKTDKKLKVLKEIFEGKTSELFMAFINIITEKGRESVLPEMSESFINLYKTHFGIVSATVTTAIKLDDKMKGEIAGLLNKDLQQIEIEEKIDPSILGGFIVKVGDKQIDSSVKNQLLKLKQEFSQNLYESKL